MTDNKKNNTIQMTQEGYEELKAELEELKQEKLPKAIDRVAQARSHGDLSENAEYSAAKEDLEFLENRIDELEDKLSRAKVVKKSKGKAKKVALGTAVTVQVNNNKEMTHTYHVVSEVEADPLEHKISNESPLGKALMGKKQGQRFTITVPAGKKEYEILKIQ